MQKYSFVFIATILISLQSCAQSWNLKDVQNTVEDAVNTVSGNGGSLSNDDIIKGLKEALSVGTTNSTGKASKFDGFYKNNLIKIPFPPEAKQVKTTVENLGMKPQVDKFVMTLNRAAEEASKEAKPIFINAITSMSIQDGMTILKGNNDAATQYLKGKTQAQLNAAFSPIVKKAIQKVELTKYWKPIVTQYNKVPFVQKVNPDLEKYVTDKALEGLFKLVAEEETKIRKDPAARVSEILRRVFGGE
jgi:hypothetical protein